MEKLVKMENEHKHLDYDKLLGTCWEATNLVEKLLKDHSEATKSVESSISKLAGENLQRAHDYIVFWRVCWTIDRNFTLLERGNDEKQRIEDIKLSKVILKSAGELDCLFEPLGQFKQGLERVANSLSKIMFANLYLSRKDFNVGLNFANTASKMLDIKYKGEFQQVFLLKGRGKLGNEFETNNHRY